MKKSIARKINVLLATSLIVLSVLMITVNLYEMYRNITTNADIMISKSCESQAAILNGKIEVVEESVNSLLKISENLRPDVELLKDEAVANAFYDEVLKYSLMIADNTESAFAIYYRVNPEITNSGTSGFYYIKNAKTNQFEPTEITDLYSYDANDIDHVGWYYVPVWEGKPVWMYPYYNANLDIEMISYVIPIFEDSNLIGVLGMDIDFNVLKTIAEDISIYQSSGAVLCDMSNNELYYDKRDLFGNTIPDDIGLILNEADSPNKMITHKVNGVNYCMYYLTLKNGMKLLVYAKQSEVFATANASLVGNVIIFLLIFVATLIFSLRMGKRIINPLKRITEATVEYSQGKWDTKVSCNTEDELQILAENISVMADKTKEYIEYIQDMAKKDGLTGLRNKSDYIRYVEQLKKEHGIYDRSYAVVIFDVNNLKLVNDNYGHEKGDELLLLASRTICTYFSHSPVFRVGGDEFVAIIDGRDYDNWKDILKDFQKAMEATKDCDDVMNVCIASGAADYTEADSYDVIFAVADQRMYENKKYLKNGVEPR